MTPSYAIREVKTGRLWQCPGATIDECRATMLLWLSWGIRCVVTKVGERRGRPRKAPIDASGSAS